MLVYSKFCVTLLIMLGISNAFGSIVNNFVDQLVVNKNDCKFTLYFLQDFCTRFFLKKIHQNSFGKLFDRLLENF